MGLLGGAISRALIGFVGGLTAGPVGSLLGAVAGAVIGGSIAVGPEVDVSDQDRFWRQEYAARPYVPDDASYADYGPAYRHGSRAALHSGRLRDWPAAQDRLARNWEAAREDPRLA